LREGRRKKGRGKEKGKKGREEGRTGRMRLGREKWREGLGGIRPGGRGGTKRKRNG